MRREQEERAKRRQKKTQRRGKARANRDAAAEKSYDEEAIGPAVVRDGDLEEAKKDYAQLDVDLDDLAF